MRDQVRYRLPFGRLEVTAHRLGARRDIEVIVDDRARSIGAIFGQATNPAPREYAVDREP
jgi:hypothetical protein